MVRYVTVIINPPAPCFNLSPAEGPLATVLVMGSSAVSWLAVHGPERPKGGWNCFYVFEEYAPKVLPHAKTLRIMHYTQKRGRLPKVGLGLCGKTFVYMCRLI